MPVIASAIEQQIYSFIKQSQSEKQEDPDKAIREFSKNLSEVIVDAIKSGTVVLDSGTVIVVGSPSTQTNPAPIVGRIE